MRARNSPRGDLLGSAGWLMAELAMILVVIMAGSVGASQIGTPASSTPPTLPPEPEPTQRGLSPVPLQLWTSVSGRSAIKAYKRGAKDIAAQLAHMKVQPGLILLFGIGAEKEGLRWSAGVRKHLQPGLDKRYPAKPVIRAYYKGPNGKLFKRQFVYAEIYYFAG